MTMKVEKAFKAKEQPVRDNYYTRVVGITNLGKQPGYVWKGEEIPATKKVEVTFELVTSSMNDGRPFHISKEYTNSDTSKNTQALFLACNVADMDWDLLLNKPCMAFVDVNEKGYANIKSVAGVPTGIAIPELRNTIYSFNIYAEHPDLEAFNSFSDFKKGKITAALDFNDTKLAQELAREATDDSAF